MVPCAQPSSGALRCTPQCIIQVTTTTMPERMRWRPTLTRFHSLRCRLIATKPNSVAPWAASSTSRRGVARTSSTVPATGSCATTLSTREGFLQLTSPCSARINLGLLLEGRSSRTRRSSSCPTRATANATLPHACFWFRQQRSAAAISAPQGVRYSTPSRHVPIRTSRGISFAIPS